jgi:hypothetical protein
MKTIKVEAPPGHEFDSFDESEGVIRFKETPKEIKERVKTFEDACAVLNITVPQFITPVTSDDRAVIAFQKLTIIIRALNEGWEPNWGDHNESKYYAWFKFQQGSDKSSGFGFSYYDWSGSHTGTYVGARLCLKTSGLAVYAGQQFTELYKDYLTL